MRLTKEHVGKKVRNNTACLLGELLAVYDRYIWLDEQNAGVSTVTNADNWELIEEPKKPSERIQELIGPTRSDAEWSERFQQAVLTYLDEQHEKLTEQREEQREKK